MLHSLRTSAITPPSGTRVGLPTLLLRIIVLACATAALPAAAQSVIITPSIEPALAQYLRRQNPPRLASQPPQPPLSPYQIGPVALHPEISYSYTNADGIPIRGSGRVSAEIHTIAAGVTADLSDRWTLDYQPSWTYYSGNSLQDSFEHSASLSGVYPLQNSTVQLTQSYASTNRTLVETAQQTKQEKWSTTLSSAYDFSQKTQFRTALSLNTRDTRIGTSLRTWSLNTGINYQVSPRLSLALTPGFSYTEVDDAPDFYGETYRASVDWQLSEKITLGASAGMRKTKSSAANGVGFSHPVYNFSVGYQPFDTTTLSVGASQSVSDSYFRNQATKNRRWNINLDQRLLGRLYLNANYGRQDSDYESLTTSSATNRADLVEHYGCRLSTKLFRRVSVAAKLQKSKNTSSATGFSFSSRQYGVELGYKY